MIKFKMIKKYVGLIHVVVFLLVPSVELNCAENNEGKGDYHNTYYYPDEDGIRGHDPSIPFMTSVRYYHLTDIPRPIVEKTLNLIEKENKLRESFEGKKPHKDINFAQFCLHAIYKDGSVISYEGVKPQDPCKGLFYLSGQKPKPYGDKSKDSTHKDSAHFVDLQTVGTPDSFVRIIQRAQPSLEPFQATIKYLQRIESYVNRVNENIRRNILEVGITKTDEVKSLLERKKKVRDGIEQVINSFGLGDDSIQHSFMGFLGGIGKEVIECLDRNDLDFCLLGGKAKEKAVQMKEELYIEYIKAETKSDKGKKSVDDVLNHAQLNFRCSEQLFLFERLGLPTPRKSLILKFIDFISKQKPNEELKSIWLQIHSTQTPCKTCIINGYGHLEDKEGWVNVFFQTLKNHLKNNNISTYFFISYHKPYENKKTNKKKIKIGYEFSLPVANKFDENCLIIFDPPGPISSSSSSRELVSENLNSSKKGLGIKTKHKKKVHKHKKLSITPRVFRKIHLKKIAS